MKVSYDQIAPNVADVDVDGPQVEVTWKCPVSGREVGTSVATMAEDSALDQQVSTAVKRTLLVQLMVTINDAVGALFGDRAKAVSRAATFAANSNITSSVTKPRFSEASKNAAVVKAFSQVEGKFRWDEDRELYVARPET